MDAADGARDTALVLAVAGGHTEAATALQLASDEVEKEHIRGKVHNALEMPALRTETIRRSVVLPRVALRRSMCNEVGWARGLVHFGAFVTQLSPQPNPTLTPNLTPLPPLNNCSSSEIDSSNHLVSMCLN